MGVYRERVWLRSADGVDNMKRAVFILGMVCFLGCESTSDRSGFADSSGRQSPVATRPAGQGDQLSNQAGGMLEDDARRTRPAVNDGPRTRPDPVRHERRSPVDQPRLR